MIEIPLHDQPAVSIDVDVPRWMIALPGDEDVSTSPVFAHLLKMLPLKVTVSQWRARGGRTGKRFIGRQYVGGFFPGTSDGRGRCDFSRYRPTPTVQFCTTDNGALAVVSTIALSRKRWPSLVAV